MIVRELVERLSALNQDAIVVVSSDPEGNSLQELSSVWYNDDFGVVHDGCCGFDIVLRGPLTPELEAQGYREDDLWGGDDVEAGVVLWPL